MAKIYFIMGKSSTGKDTVYKKLLEIKNLSLKRVIGYTTRPVRAGEKEGKDYHFCSEESRQNYLDQGKVIEMRSYPTVQGDWFYFTVDDGQIDFDGVDMLMIGTLESFFGLRKYYKDRDIIPIYIEVEDGERLQRAIERERRQKKPGYKELCRRFLADSEDFSEENLKKAGISVRFENIDMDQTVKTIADYIKERSLS